MEHRSSSPNGGKRVQRPCLQQEQTLACLGSFVPSCGHYCWSVIVLIKRDDLGNGEWKLNLGRKQWSLSAMREVFFFRTLGKVLCRNVTCLDWVWGMAERVEYLIILTIRYFQEVLARIVCKVGTRWFPGTFGKMSQTWAPVRKSEYPSLSYRVL